jgi:hypothetical protein
VNFQGSLAVSLEDLFYKCYLHTGSLIKAGPHDQQQNTNAKSAVFDLFF